MKVRKDYNISPYNVFHCESVDFFTMLYIRNKLNKYAKKYCKYKQQAYTFFVAFLW